MYPLAWAVVELENTRSWMWFIETVKNDLELENGAGLAICSDMHKVCNLLIHLNFIIFFILQLIMILH